MKTLEQLVTVNNLKKWLKTKDPAERFSYTNPEACCVAQFARANGYPNAIAGSNYMTAGERGDKVRFPHSIAYAVLLSETFGEVLRKLEVDEEIKRWLTQCEVRARQAGWIAEVEYNGENDGLRHPVRGDWAETWEAACSQEDERQQG